jgi:transcriptional regulator of heat shock response
MLASQRAAVGNGIVHVDVEGHSASHETHCLHGQQRRLVVARTSRMQTEKKKKLQELGEELRDKDAWIVKLLEAGHRPRQQVKAGMQFPC